MGEKRRKEIALPFSKCVLSLRVGNVINADANLRAWKNSVYVDAPTPPSLTPFSRYSDRVSSDDRDKYRPPPFICIIS